MNILVIAGHISYDARKYEHLIDLYDKNIINNIILPMMRDKDKIDVICSPNCFDPLNDDQRLSYKLIVENDALCCEWIIKNISKYDFVIALSDVFGNLKDEAIVKSKPCIVFNTLGIDVSITWDDFMSLNWHSVTMVGATCAITRFIEEPLRYYICHKDMSQFEIFGYESLKEYLSKILVKSQYKIDIANIKSMPTLKQVLDYESAYNSIKALDISWFDIDLASILIHDREQDRYLISFAANNKTFALISQRETGTECARVEVSHRIPLEYFKMIHMLKLKVNFNICLFFPSKHNFLNALYIIPNYPDGNMTSRQEIRNIINQTFFEREAEFMQSFAIYEEGRGYYIVGKTTEDIVSFLAEQRLLTHNKMPIFYRDNIVLTRTLQDNLSGKFWKEFNVCANIKKDERVLDMDAISDIVLDNINKNSQVYQHNTFYNFNEKIYYGKLSPYIKFDHIIYAFTYNAMALSHSEVERYWNWLSSMLNDKGKIYIIGQDLIEPQGDSKTKMIVGQSALGTYQISYNELASTNAKRYAIVNGNILTYFNPLDTMSMDIITKQFNYKKIPYSKKSEIYIHMFTKKEK